MKNKILFLISCILTLIFSIPVSAELIEEPEVTAVYNSSNGGDIRLSGTSDAQKVAIYRTNAGKRVKIATIPAGQTSYMDKSIKDNCWGKVYSYSISTITGGKESRRSGEKVLQRLAPMKITKATSADPGKATLEYVVSTGSNKALGYEIQYAKSKSDLQNRSGSFKAKTVDGRTKTKVTIGGLSEGATYYFRVRAYVNYTHSKTGVTTKTWSQYSNVKSVTIKTTPPEPMVRYDEGQYIVGRDIPAGEYIFYTTSTTYSGYYCESRDAAAKDIVDNDLFTYNAIYTVTAGNYLKLERCYALSTKYSTHVDTSKPGEFIVGRHIGAGTYQVVAIDDKYEGYYCVYPDSRKQRIVSNDLFKNNAYVTVTPGQLLCLTRAVLVH